MSDRTRWITLALTTLSTVLLGSAAAAAPIPIPVGAANELRLEFVVPPGAIGDGSRPVYFDLTLDGLDASETFFARSANFVGGIQIPPVFLWIDVGGIAVPFTGATGPRTDFLFSIQPPSHFSGNKLTLGLWLDQGAANLVQFSAFGFNPDGSTYAFETPQAPGVAPEPGLLSMLALAGLGVIRRRGMISSR